MRTIIRMLLALGLAAGATPTFADSGERAGSTTEASAAQAPGQSSDARHEGGDVRASYDRASAAPAHEATDAGKAKAKASKKSAPANESAAPAGDATPTFTDQG